MNQSFKDGGFVHGAEEPQKQPLPGEVYKTPGAYTAFFDPDIAQRVTQDAQRNLRQLELQLALISYENNWRRICQALDKHHPQWIDGNGSAIDKVVKFIEEVKS